ncbi:hypothetical protein C5C31_00445 [Rathayibacter rathayi]|uniref:Leucine-binding protein domain-containing protein n=1 Tax=Rathayibacter rathayi TaxID=33887 RepID=A0ABD6W7N3_RATRA|nr:hypothetical protein [Rathayibacter rathayi]AZZ49309.1 hypothetical protein C1O28_08940 [Rathayibacter rathayi]MWV73393.1 hypothetical protein [Rathayibacter rathayi NCPPB 2980 = VKM Ac-1601]PPF12737.1 hypothetical protein C5C04_10420 [Rathayibacter rathayi]PPF20929.1 hypothetical protein C5C34_13820 [Rathayibacter rathayi]PPF44024.1 hypothetical protein C5C08_13610 [Rathayibacter rathayi]
MTRPARRAAPRARPNRRTILLISAVVCALLALGGVLVSLLPPRSAPTTSVAALPVGFSCARVPEQLKLGVVVSLSAAPGEGAEWKDAANGAVVAARRFEMGGCEVGLVAADDHGTPEGARAAIEQLAGEQVSGIVLATRGGHTGAALEAARAAGIALVLPYGGDPAGSGDGAWLTAPDTAAADAALVEAAGADARVLLVDAGGGTPHGLSPAATVTADPGATADALIAAARPHLEGTQTVDRVVVSGPAAAQAVAVAALQAAGSTAPVLLTPDALSPAFAPALIAAGGTLSGDLTTVGADSGDAVALRGDERGRAASAFLGAVRMTADDSAGMTLLGDREFDDVAAVADASSHDAVVALVRAAAAAGSSTPSAVTAALAGSTVGPADGLVGPTLDFGAASVLTSAVVPLHASPQDLGLRPTDPPLLWFAGQTRT